MARTVGIGIQSFEKLIQNGYFYIDKTDFIREWWESGDEVTLITRPRRFGKTLNMNMAERFLSIEYAGQGAVFKGLSIWEEDKYQKLQGTYPVIFLSFADIKANNFSLAREKICMAIKKLYSRYDFLLASGYLKVERYFIDEEWGRDTYELTLTNREVRFMFGQMIDGWFKDFAPEYNDFVKAMMAGDIKGHECLYE